MKRLANPAALISLIWLFAWQANSQPADLGEANIRTPFRADGRFCYLYLGIAKGYFTREGLKVRIDEGENSVQVLQTVGAGQDFMTYPSLNLLPLIRAQGAQIRAVAVMEQQHPAGVVVHGSGDIQSPHQLAGKTILVGPGDAATLLPPFLRGSGVDPSTVKVVNTDHRTKLQSFLAKKGDGAAIFSEGELPVILKQDPQARFFPYDKVFSMYGLGLVVHEKTIAERPQAVGAAVRGMLAAERQALKNPEECIDALAAAFPDRKFDPEISLNQLKEHQKLLTPGKEKMGRMSDERWKGLEALLVQYFGLKPSARRAADYYTNEFVPAE
jgi:NitT/TauT family transport system substrate-binding protein